MPAVVIHGAIDQLSPLANGEELARLIPGAQLVVFEKWQQQYVHSFPLYAPTFPSAVSAQ